MSNKKPIFQSIFLDSWNKLPKVMHKHYANRPLSNDIVVVEGKMDIEFGWFIKILSPFLKASNTLVPYEGSDIPVTVRFLSEPDSHAFCLERIFYLPNKKPYIFYSKLTQLHDDIVIEIMKFNIGWKHRFYYNGKKIILEHRGYVLRLFGKTISLPIEWLFGKIYAEEEALSENKFRMHMKIIHPLFGKIYQYSGEFKIKEMIL